jgi:hypothetical protein
MLGEMGVKVEVKRSLPCCKLCGKTPLFVTEGETRCDNDRCVLYDTWTTEAQWWILMRALPESVEVVLRAVDAWAEVLIGDDDDQINNLACAREEWVMDGRPGLDARLAAKGEK